MSRTQTQSMFTRRVDESGSRRCPDDLLVEEPISIRLDGVQIATTMRTPGHDFELAAGFCWSEGALGEAAISGIRYCGTGPAAETDFNVVTVDTNGQAPEPTPRLGLTSSSCGLCGADAIAELASRLEPLGPYEPWSVRDLQSFPDLVSPYQSLFAATGSSHAAAAISRSGEVVLVREDIGRHNAVDKVVGNLLLQGHLPASELALFVSGRASFEIVQKVWAAGFTALVAVSGGSALSVQTARQAGLTMLGFARGSSSTIYHSVE